MTLRPAIFFDRDGVVNISPGSGYVTSVVDFHLMPGIIGVLAWCTAQGFYTVLVTSQQGVGKGLMSQADLDAIHDVLQNQLAVHEAAFDLIRSCSHLNGKIGRASCRERVFNPV
jgi:histidinol-phosphate phosphatase family protein